MSHKMAEVEEDFLFVSLLNVLGQYPGFLAKEKKIKIGSTGPGPRQR